MFYFNLLCFFEGQTKVGYVSSDSMIGYNAFKGVAKPGFFSSVWRFPSLSSDAQYKTVRGKAMDQLNCVIPQFFWYKYMEQIVFLIYFLQD